MCQLALGQHAQDIRLVLVGVDGAVQLDEVVDARFEPRVMAGGDGVEAEGQATLQHRRELDLLVAAHAGVGRAARGILADEVRHHRLVEAFAHVPDVEGDPDHVGGSSRVVGVLDRAAAASTASVRRRVARQGEMNAGDVVARLGGAGGRDSGVDATAHGGEYLHADELGSAVMPASRARRTAGSMARATRSTSSWTDVCPKVNRSDPRALASSLPIASSTCDA